jgi:hypothetical protein
MTHLSTESVREAFDRLTVESQDPTLHGRHAAHVAAVGSWVASLSCLDGPQGSALVERCDACGYVRVDCAHSRCWWDDHGTVLTCALCGRDVT